MDSTRPWALMMARDMQRRRADDVIYSCLSLSVSLYISLPLPLSLSLSFSLCLFLPTSLSRLCLPVLILAFGIVFRTEARCSCDLDSEVRSEERLTARCNHEREHKRKHDVDGSIL